MDWETSRRKKAAIKAEEASGNVVDSMEVRKALMQKVHSGEMTLEQAQAQLAAIKRSAGALGKITRSQAFSQG